MWCNFTLTVLEDSEEDEADHSRGVGITQMNRYLQEKPPSLHINNRGSLPKFFHLDKMEKARLIVKPPGATVTFKCRANGNHFKGR